MWNAVCVAGWGAGFALQRSLRTHAPAPPDGTRTAVRPRPEPAAAGQDPAAALMGAATPWERFLIIDRLAATLKPGEWAALMRTLKRENRDLAQALLPRWLAKDTEAALRFVAESSCGGEFSGYADLHRVAVLYLAATDPERGWAWTGELRAGESGGCRAELLAALCEHDPVAAARFVTAHGDSSAAWGVAFPDMTAASTGPAVRALAAEPDSLLRRRMLLHTMSDWASKDFEGALDWWRRQPPRTQGLTLRGLGMALHILSPTEGSYFSKGPVILSPADLTAMADTALNHASPEDRRDFFARFLIHMSPTDPVRAVEWVLENLHGRERRERLESAVAYLKPKGALEMVAAWDRLPQTGWQSSVFDTVASEAANSDPALTLDWALRLPAGQAERAGDSAGYAWGVKDPAAARRQAESLTDPSPASAAFAAGVANALIPQIGSANPFGSGSGQKPTPEEMRKGMTPVLEWAGHLPGERGAAAAGRVLAFWAQDDAAGAAAAAAGLTAPEARGAGLKQVAERFFLKDPDAALAWAGQLDAPDREIVRGIVSQSKLAEEAKTNVLTRLGAQEEEGAAATAP